MIIRNLIRSVILSAFFCVSGASLLAQPVLTVSFQETNLVFTAPQFAALPHTEIKAMDGHEQMEHQYSGVAVRELLSQAGVPAGDKLRGAALRDVVVVRARDGYTVAFTLADFDDTFGGRNIVLADHVDGNLLSTNAGPLRLIVPGDKKAARWARMVNKIEVFDVDRKTETRN
jgi:hypothetical protein